MAAAGMVVLVVYMGFVYSASKGIPFWNSPLHPLLYMTYALRGGSAALLVAIALLGTPDRGFQEQLAKRVVAEDLSVREVEEAIRRHDSQAAESTPATPAPSARAQLRPPGLLELEDLLGDYLDTRVKITMGPRHGRVQVEFANLEDLERIYRVMTQGAATRA